MRRALVRRHRLHRAHVVHAVGELDQDDAHVARHRQQHLAEGFGLRFLAGRELELVELGQAVDEVGRGCPEALDQLGLGDAAVLHRVVHQRGHEGLRVELPLGAQAGHRDRVRDVGLAAGAELAQVRLVGEAVGLAHAAHVGLVEVVQLGGQDREREQRWPHVRPAPRRCAGWHRHLGASFWRCEEADRWHPGHAASMRPAATPPPASTSSVGWVSGNPLSRSPGLDGLGLARPSPGREEHAAQDIGCAGHHGFTLS